MTIREIEYAIRFWVEDYEGNEVAEEVFYDLYEMNAYIRRTWREEKYECVEAKFSPVEIINGVPENAITFEFNISPYMELEDEELEELMADIIGCFEDAEKMGRNCGNNTKFSPNSEADDYLAKRSTLSDYAYICPHCYYELTECRCSGYPYYLVQVDKLMVPVVRLLNKKGYITTACCAGHLDDLRGRTIYVAFEKEHEFGINLPSGAEYAKTGRCVQYRIPDDMTKSQFSHFQSRCIEQFVNWVNNLPSIISLA